LLVVQSRLSELVEEAARGDSFIITRDSKPMVQVVAIESATPKKIRRLGFLKGKISVPDNVKEIDREEIERMFYGGES
jgi:antitoxin (DNA-binding transcriptional repressor) of toxin-antitoxin stability system